MCERPAVQHLQMRALRARRPESCAAIAALAKEEPAGFVEPAVRVRKPMLAQVRFAARRHRCVRVAPRAGELVKHVV